MCAVRTDSSLQPDVIANFYLRGPDKFKVKAREKVRNWKESSENDLL